MPKSTQKQCSNEKLPKMCQQGPPLQLTDVCQNMPKNVFFPNNMWIKMCKKRFFTSCVFRRVLLPSPPPPPANKLSLGLVPGDAMVPIYKKSKQRFFFVLCFEEKEKFNTEIRKSLILRFFFTKFFVLISYTKKKSLKLTFKVWPRIWHRRLMPRGKKRSGKEKEKIFSKKKYLVLTCQTFWWNINPEAYNLLFYKLFILCLNFMVYI